MITPLKNYLKAIVIVHGQSELCMGAIHIAFKYSLSF